MFHAYRYLQRVRPEKLIRSHSYTIFSSHTLIQNLYRFWWTKEKIMEIMQKRWERLS